MAEVGKNIKKIRKEQNLTQDDLAERLHCTRQTISNYENGKSEPNIALLVEIANVLGVEVNDLIYGPKKKENRRSQKIRSVAALAAACALLMAIETLTPFAKQYGWKTFETAPLYLLRYVLRPLVLALFGWGIAEAGKAFAGIRLWEGRTERTVKVAHTVFYIAAVILTAFAVLALWTAVDLTYIWWLSERMMRVQGSFDSSAVPHLMPGQLQNLFLRLNVFGRLGGGALFLGAALGFCKVKKEETEKRDGNGSEWECNSREPGRGKNRNHRDHEGL